MTMTMTATKRPATEQAAAWTQLSVCTAELHHEANGPRRPDRLRRSTVGVLILLRSVGVNIETVPTASPRNVRAGRLTEREYDVLRGIAEGKSNAEIAAAMFLSEDTVKTHVRRMFRKIGARHRAHAVAIGFRKGLLQ